MTKAMSLAAALAVVLLSSGIAAADGQCMRDGDGNLWGDCSGGYDANGAPQEIYVYAAAPPSTAETAFNIVTNWTGLPGNIISTINSVAQWAGGWEAIMSTYGSTCSDNPAYCSGFGY